MGPGRLLLACSATLFDVESALALPLPPSRPSAARHTLFSSDESGRSLRKAANYHISPSRADVISLSLLELIARKHFPFVAERIFLSFFAVRPEGGPEIRGLRAEYAADDIIDVMCTSRRAFPAAHLDFFINDEPVSEEEEMERTFVI